jgi:hypothetical protein
VFCVLRADFAFSWSSDVVGGNKSLIMKLIPNMALHVKEKTTPTLSIPVMEEMERMPCTSRRPDQRRIKNASPPSPAAPAGNALRCTGELERGRGAYSQVVLGSHGVVASAVVALNSILQVVNSLLIESVRELPPRLPR